MIITVEQSRARLSLHMLRTAFPRSDTLQGFVIFSDGMREPCSTNGTARDFEDRWLHQLVQPRWYIDARPYYTVRVVSIAWSRHLP